MPICRFFERGNCRNGNNCNFDHVLSNDGGGGGRGGRGGGRGYDGYNSDRNDSRGGDPFFNGARRGGSNQGGNDRGNFSGNQNNYHQRQNDTKMFIDPELIRTELTKERPIWPLSCYAPKAEAPRHLFDGELEVSPEEMRLKAYMFVHQNAPQNALQEEAKLNQTMNDRIATALKDPKAAAIYVAKGAGEHPNRNDIMEASTKAPGGLPADFAFSGNNGANNAQPSQQTQANPFGQPSQNANPFGTQQPKADPFGTAQTQQNANPFGAPQTKQNANPFGPNPQPNAFQTQPQQNPFGTQQSQQQQTNPFGTPQQNPNPFGAQQPQQTNANPFGQQTQQQNANPFGQPSQQQNANPFGPSQQPKASPFSQAGQQGDPFGQSQASNGSFTQVNGFAKAALPANPFGQPQASNPFGNNNHQSNGAMHGFSNPPTRVDAAVVGKGGAPDPPEALYGENTESFRTAYAQATQTGAFTDNLIPFLPPKAEWIVPDS